MLKWRKPRTFEEKNWGCTVGEGACSESGDVVLINRRNGDGACSNHVAFVPGEWSTDGFDTLTCNGTPLSAKELRYVARVLNKHGVPAPRGLKAEKPATPDDVIRRGKRIKQ